MTSSVILTFQTQTSGTTYEAFGQVSSQEQIVMLPKHHVHMPDGMDHVFIVSMSSDVVQSSSLVHDKPASSSFCDRHDTCQSVTTYSTLTKLLC